MACSILEGWISSIFQSEKMCKFKIIKDKKKTDDNNETTSVNSEYIYNDG